MNAATEGLHAARSFMISGNRTDPRRPVSAAAMGSHPAHAIPKASARKRTVASSLLWADERTA
jgi:hypothetical protein